MNNENRTKKYADLFDILSNEVRLCILTSLCMNNEKNVTGLQYCAKTSQSVVSQQLSKLKAMGIITAKKVSNEVYYSIIDKEIERIIKQIVLDEKKD